MMSTAVALTTLFSFRNEANAQTAAIFINETVKGSAAVANEKSLTVNSTSKSSQNDAIELLIDLGGQHIK